MGKIQVEIESGNITLVSDIEKALIEVFPDDFFTVRPLPQPNAEEKDVNRKVVELHQALKPHSEKVELPEEIRYDTYQDSMDEHKEMYGAINKLIKWAKKHEEGR